MKKIPNYSKCPKNVNSVWPTESTTFTYLLHLGSDTSCAWKNTNKYSTTTKQVQVFLQRSHINLVRKTLTLGTNVQKSPYLQKAQQLSRGFGYGIFSPLNWMICLISIPVATFKYQLFPINAMYFCQRLTYLKSLRSSEGKINKIGQCEKGC